MTCVYPPGCDGSSDAGAGPRHVHSVGHRRVRHPHHVHEEHREPQQERQEAQTC